MKITLELTIEEFERWFNTMRGEANTDNKGDISVSKYARTVDMSNDIWRRNMVDFECVIRYIQNLMNERLKKDKYVFLNTVYDALNLSRTKAGAVCGWMYSDKGDNPDGDNFIIIEIEAASNDSYILDFNVDGEIFTKIVEEGLL